MIIWIITLCAFCRSFSFRISRLMNFKCSMLVNAKILSAFAVFYVSLSVIFCFVCVCVCMYPNESETCILCAFFLCDVSYVQVFCIHSNILPNAIHTHVWNKHKTESFGIVTAARTTTTKSTPATIACWIVNLKPTDINIREYYDAMKATIRYLS